MVTAILIPSLNRPQRIRPTAEAIHAATPEPHRIYWLVSDWESEQAIGQLGEWCATDYDTTDRRYVTRMNKLVSQLDDDVDFIFFGSDDVIHHPGWVREAMRVFADPTIQLVVVNDLRNQNGTQAIIRRAYLEFATFDAPGMPFHRGYQHNFADTEQFLTAHVRGVYARSMSSFVEHLHPVMNGPKKIDWDDTYLNAAKGFDKDQELFRARAELIVADLSPVP